MELSVNAGDSTSPFRLTSISKRFGATQALFEADLELHAGEIHGLAGENGAGKSTLGKILAGIYQQDSGAIFVDNKLADKWHTAKAQKQGIVLIAQELSLVPELSVVENVFLGVESSKFGVLKSDTKARFSQLESDFNFGLKPEQRLGDLRIADRQKVEIMRALARNARLIIMDEPTSSLTADEVNKLHLMMKMLKDRGRTIVYVTHFLESLLEVSDRVTVMRDGRVVKTSYVSSESKFSLVESMLGRSLEHTFPPRASGASEKVKPKLEMRNVWTSTGLQDISLTFKPGEIVGLAGLVGSGRTEIARAIFGIDSITSGQILLDGEVITRNSPQRAVESGMAFIPEDRRAQGLVMVRPVRENISIPHLSVVSKFKTILKDREKQIATELSNRVSLTPPNISSIVSDFSGGNQQKVLFAKWLMGDPSFIILDEPTRGVDIGAKVTIYEIIKKLAQQGTAILLISSEHSEVLALSNRVHLVRNGRIVGEVDPASTSIDQLLFKLFGLNEGLKEERKSS